MSHHLQAVDSAELELSLVEPLHAVEHSTVQHTAAHHITAVLELTASQGRISPHGSKKEVMPEVASHSTQQNNGGSQYGKLGRKKW